MGFFSRHQEELPWVWDGNKQYDTQSVKPSVSYPTNTFGSMFDGEQFFSGITGIVDDVSSLDYWTLRKRSSALFRTNSYAQGIVRRLVTNIIHKGIFPQFEPEESIIGLQEDSLVDWADQIEIKFRLYGDTKEIIDSKRHRTFGMLQAQAYQEALIDGDCLVICRQHKSGLPNYQLVSGNRVQTPTEKWADKNVVDGIKLDKNGAHVGYYVYLGTDDQPDERYMYVPSRGSKSGRLTAWMVYSPVMREDDFRGTPLLAVAIQPLNEILKYRGSAQLKAELSARITTFIKRAQEPPRGLSAIGKGAAKRDTLNADPSGATKAVTIDKVLPGMIVSHLNPGDEPVMYPHATDVNFGQFEAAVISGLSWALEIPPECLLLSYGSNFAASQASLREFIMFIDKERDRFSFQFCQPIAEEWFISSVLLNQVEAAGFLDAFFTGNVMVVRAWLSIDWIGSIKPSLKLNDEVFAQQHMVSNGWDTNARASRSLTGTSFERNIRKIAKENQMKAEAMRPLLELEREYGSQSVASVSGLLPLTVVDNDDEETA